MNPMGRTIENHVSCSFNLSVSEKKIHHPKNLHQTFNTPGTRACTFSISSMAMAHEGGKWRPGGNEASDRRVVRYGWLGWWYVFRFDIMYFYQLHYRKLQTAKQTKVQTQNY